MAKPPDGPRDPNWNRSIEGFPAYISGNSIESAEVVVPLVLELVAARSVVDFGCKHGEWLYVFRRHGVDVVLGFDLPTRVGRIIVDASEFRAADLSRPVAVGRRFDLAVCLEVAEHLPGEAASTLVSSITGSAPVVLFSAAMPDQGGHGHRNEQPRDYWHDLFGRAGYAWLDCLRPRIWQDGRVAWWYRQNLFLYASEEAMAATPALKRERERRVATDVDLVHASRLRRPRRWLRLFRRRTRPSSHSS